MNNSSINILNRNNLDIDNDIKEQNNDNHSNNSGKWALKIDINKMEEDKKNNKSIESGDELIREILQYNEPENENKDKKEVEDKKDNINNNENINKEEQSNDNDRICDKKNIDEENNNEIINKKELSEKEKKEENEIKKIGDDFINDEDNLMENQLNIENNLEEKDEMIIDEKEKKEKKESTEDKKENITNNKNKEIIMGNNDNTTSDKNKKTKKNNNNLLIFNNNNNKEKGKNEDITDDNKELLIDDNNNDLIKDDNNDLLIDDNIEELKINNNNEKKDENKIIDNNESKKEDLDLIKKDENNELKNEEMKEIKKGVIEENKDEEMKEKQKEEIKEEDKNEKLEDEKREKKKEEGIKIDNIEKIKEDKKEEKKSEKENKKEEDIKNEEIKENKKEEEELKEIEKKEKMREIMENNKKEYIIKTIGGKEDKNKREKIIEFQEEKNYSSDNKIEQKSSNRQLKPFRYHRKNVIKRTNEKSFNLDEIGKIENAKKHASANSILKQKKAFDENTEFCPCCCLPCKTNGILETFSYCDNTDDFINLGEGTSLYFSFFKYSIFIIFVTSLVIGIPFLIFTYNYTDSLQGICNYYYLNRFYLNENYNLSDYCQLYITVEEYASDNYSYVDSPFFLFSSINIKDYRNIYYKMYNDTNENFEKTVLSFPLLNLIISITLLIINVFYIIVIYNKSFSYDYKLTSPSDYTVKIDNLNKALSHYLSVRKKYEELKEKEPNKLNEDGSPFNFEQKIREELGINDIFAEKTNKRKKGKMNMHMHNKKISRLEEFSEFLEKKICVGVNDKKYNIEQINICFRLNKFMELEDNLQWKNTQIVKINNHPYQIEKNKSLNLEGENRRYFGSILSGYNLYWLNCYDKGIPLSQLEEDKTNIEKEIENLLKQSEDINETNFAGVAFVSFNTIKEQEDYLSQFPNNIFSYFLKIILDLKYIFCFCFTKKDLKTNLDVTAAPEPEDVIYENLEYSYIHRTIRTIIVYIISIILILICLGIFIGLNMLQEIVNDKAIHLILCYILSLCNTCVSSCLNIIFQMILDYLTKREKVHTMTEYYRSYSVKLALFTFFTSAVVPLICEFIRKSRGYEILISNMLMMFLVNAFVTPIMWTMNFTYFLKKFQICLIEYRKDPDSKHNMTQRELNDLYELPSMSISYKYSYLAKTLLMTFLYIPIFPLGIIISLCGFILGYLLEKFNFAYMYKRPEMLNHKLCVFYVNHFDVIIFVFAIGDYIFMRDTYENETIPLVKIILFGIFTIIPYSKLLKLDFIGIQESILNNEKFEDKYFSFASDYERSNPMTRKKGIKHYLKKLLESKRISFKKYEELIYNADSLNLMKVYYESRKNKYIFDAQRNFARIIGNKFIKLDNEINNDNNDVNIIKDNNNNDNKKIIFGNEDSNDNDNDNKKIIFGNENSNDNNAIEVKEEKVEKKEGNNIANFYNNPFFMDYGCTIQSYVKQITEQSENNGEKKEDNLMIIKENKNEDEKGEY